MRTLTLSLLLLTAAAAHAEPAGSASRRGAASDGKNEISTQLGFQASLGATTPAGVKLFIDYSRRLTDLVWFNVKFNPVFATGGSGGVCTDRFGAPYDCGETAFFSNGYAMDLLAGIKLKFAVPSLRALVPYANIDAGVVAIFNRPVHDNGAALVLHTGGGIKYFVTPHIGLGGEINVTLGPGFYSQTCGSCNNGHNELYRAIDFAAGAEFDL